MHPYYLGEDVLAAADGNHRFGASRAPLRACPGRRELDGAELREYETGTLGSLVPGLSGTADRLPLVQASPRRKGL